MGRSRHNWLCWKTKKVMEDVEYRELCIYSVFWLVGSKAWLLLS